ncbi:ATP-dependent helicase [Candidatus Palauibacter sp.]|uniref:ATP-dependent helicase n=1 Tax=Candidatus Palauibacter sp. TaxID=3101350 RepID=UPI003AF20154
MSGLRLNPEQREAVEHREGPLLVLAGAGSGKTRVLTARAARLIEYGLEPTRLLAVTFTNKAAGEMRERIEGLIGRSTRGLWIGTFHSIAARLLRIEAPHTSRTRAFTIYDEDDSVRTVKDVMVSVGYDPKRWSPRAVRGRISTAKNALVGPAEYASETFDLLTDVITKVYPAYQRELERRNAYDFDDLLFETVRLLEKAEGVQERYSARFEHVLVDEYQDTNHAQYRIVKALAATHRNLCVVGDDDQAVYGWRGADIRNILDFEADFSGAHVVRLEQNYRSTGSILEVANAVISQNLARKPKRLRTRRETGDPIQVVRCGDERAEAGWVSSEIGTERAVRGLNEFAVLYRTNAQSRAFEEAFRRRGLPYRIVGGVPFYERREVKDVIAYLRLLVNPADDVAFLRAVGWPRRGVGAKSIERLAALAVLRDEPLALAAARVGQGDGIPRAALRGLGRFTDALREVQVSLADCTAREAMENCVATFGLATALAEEEDGPDRLENVSELFAAAEAFERDDAEDAIEEATDLELFLQSVSLRSDLDEADFDGEAVTLITLHNAKGLEFPVVYLAGLEEGLFPLSRAVETPGGLEEERRLFYVGVTRAMDRLSLTYADQRWRAGMASRSAPSSFLDELPAEHVHPRLARPTWGGSRPTRSGPPGSGRRAFGGGVPSGWSLPAPDEPSFAWRRDATKGSGREPGSGTPGELEYDFEDSQVPLALAPGVRVMHPRFGTGEILQVHGYGREAKADIDFDDAGRKRVVVAYAGLRPA